MKKLFTERHGSGKPRVVDVLDERTQVALLALLCARMDEEWFGLAFPEKCRDGYAYAGTDFAKLKATMDGYGLLWPRGLIDPDHPPPDSQIFDLVEFAYEYVAEALNPSLHKYWSHSHYEYSQKVGREKFSADVNSIFERNGVAFELKDGEINRLAPILLHESLAQTLFRSGDAILDDLLGMAREKFLHRSPAVRRESLEKLWDAWERLKTLEVADNKKASIEALLDKVASEPTLREKLDEEAKQLTQIGNEFMIRHSEVGKVPITDSAHVDYLFHRMFSMVRLLLRSSGRGG
jgi:hypothetical protein